MATRYDAVVIGGGIVGLATAFRLLERRPGLRLAVVEKEPELALHQSARNSGVLHSGLYYRPGSLKARLCREGKAALEAYAEARGVPIRRCGKLVVATEEAEVPRLGALAERGRANGVALEQIGPERIRELEPAARGLAALHVAETAIVDFRRVALALAEDVRGRGGEILLGRRVTGIRRSAGGTRLATSGGELEAGAVVACAGLQSDRVAAMSGAPRDERIVPFRGDYRVLAPGARALVRGLIYPVPDPALPFLGVHLTPRTDGEVWAGPSAVPALARERYGSWRLDPRDAAAALAFPGTWRLARRHWRAGLTELRRDLRAAALARACRRLVPALRDEDLLPGPTGIRAQAVRRDGTLVDDFSLVESPSLLHVRNAPSPGATAALAIGGVLAERLLGHLDKD